MIYWVVIRGPQLFFFKDADTKVIKENVSECIIMYNCQIIFIQYWPDNTAVVLILLWSLSNGNSSGIVTLTVDLTSTKWTASLCILVHVLTCKMEKCEIVFIQRLMDNCNNCRCVCLWTSTLFLQIQLSHILAMNIVGIISKCYTSMGHSFCQWLFDCMGFVQVLVLHLVIHIKSCPRSPRNGIIL